MQEEKKWSKGRNLEEEKLPDQEIDPTGYKRAIEKARTRLRLTFLDINSFDFFLTHTDTLKKLKSTSWSQIEANQEVTAYLYYDRGHRGRIQEFLGEKWKPHLKKVIADYGDIRKDINLENKLSAALAKLQKNNNKDQDKQAEEPENPPPRNTGQSKRKNRRSANELQIQRDPQELKMIKIQEKEDEKYHKVKTAFQKP